MDTFRLEKLNLVAFVLLIIANIWALNFPFFGRTPGDVSRLFDHPFTPADFTFRLWSVIYILLGAFIYFQGRVLFSSESKRRPEIQRIGCLFAVSTLLNILWLITWASLAIFWAFIFVLCFWIVMIMIIRRLHDLGDSHPMIFIPLSIYFSWVCISTMASLNVLLISTGFDFFDLTPSSWAVILSAIGVIGGLIIYFASSDPYFLIVLAWAYFGIYMKNIHTNESIKDMALGSMIIVLVLTLISSYKRIKKKISIAT